MGLGVCDAQVKVFMKVEMAVCDEGLLLRMTLPAQSYPGAGVVDGSE